jgi:membrane-bound lytic murein transglycosylase D
MIRIITVLVLSIIHLFAMGSPRVPSFMDFAGIELRITDAARRQIQVDVDALHRSATYFNRKLEKVDLYFPIIERVFLDENVPDDFKYLVIQESALIPDAVSTSNAVGFWQFKKMTAEEVGLRVDRHIDERMNIISATHGAAKYLKKNNFYFNNWLYALLAYNTGPGGAERYVQKKFFGARRMEIDKNTHWYVKKFLAHKVAFENEIGKNDPSSFRLYEYNKTENMSLRELSDLFQIDYQELTEYNKWIKRGKIPSDKTYTALIPVRSTDQVALTILNPIDRRRNFDVTTKSGPRFVFQSSYKPIAEFDFQQNQNYPVIKRGFISKKIKINGIPGFIATSDDNISTVSAKHDIKLKKFLKFNEMTNADKIIPGQVYYLKRKKSKAKIHYHVVLPGETAWSISQKYGLKIKKLLRKNRLREEKDLDVGMVVWLRFIRPEDVPVEYKKSAAKNLVVQSTPNGSQSDWAKSEVENSDIRKAEIEPAPPDRIPVDAEESEFLFEEVDEKTDYINENSYVNVQQLERQQKDKPDLSRKIDNEVNSSPKKDNYSKKYHIVKSGETLFSIAKAYGVSIGEIRKWNEIRNLDVLKVGQKIVIETSSTDPNENNKLVRNSMTKTYTVKKNDTLYSIARSFGLTVKELMDLNNKDDFTINEGEVLVIE